MKVLIAGPGKSGTTALFYRIRRCFGNEPVRELFEPAKYESCGADDQRHVLAKTLIDVNQTVDYASFASFDKKIGLVRDPRDWVISSLLYRVFNAPFCEDDAAAAQVLDHFRRKEEDPLSLSVLDFLRLFKRLRFPPDGIEMLESAGGSLSLPPMQSLKEFYAVRADFIVDFFRQHRDYFIVRYEDFILHNLDGLKRHLGFSFPDEEVVVDAMHQRVVRTAGAGDWRNWFLEEDVCFFQPIFAGLMDQFGYPADWDLPKNRLILPEHSSGFVRSLIAERKGITLLDDPARARRLIGQAQKKLRTFSSRYPGHCQATPEESEITDLQVAFAFLVHQWDRWERAYGKLLTTKLALHATKSKLKEARSAARDSREECRRLRQTVSWRITRPLRILAKLFRTRGGETPISDSKKGP